MRTIYTVNATIVDANGTFSTLANFPKRFDSESYNGDTQKALRRAKAAFHAVLGEMYAVDGRMIQTVTLTDVKGREILRDSEGEFPVEVAAEA